MNLNFVISSNTVKDFYRQNGYELKPLDAVYIANQTSHTIKEQIKKLELIYRYSDSFKLHEEAGFVDFHSTLRKYISLLSKREKNFKESTNNEVYVLFTYREDEYLSGVYPTYDAAYGSMKESIEYILSESNITYDDLETDNGYKIQKQNLYDEEDFTEGYYDSRGELECLINNCIDCLEEEIKNIEKVLFGNAPKEFVCPYCLGDVITLSNGWVGVITNDNTQYENNVGFKSNSINVGYINIMSSGRLFSTYGSYFEFEKIDIYDPKVNQITRKLSELLKGKCAIEDFCFVYDKLRLSQYIELEKGYLDYKFNIIRDDDGDIIKAVLNNRMKEKQNSNNVSLKCH